MPRPARLRLCNKNHSHYHVVIPYLQYKQMAVTAASLDSQSQQKRAFWLKHLHEWHWVSAALCFIGLVLFSITGFTLNHAGAIAAEPRVTTTTARLSPALLRELQQSAADTGPHLLSAEAGDWLALKFGVSVSGAAMEWSEDDVYISLPRREDVRASGEAAPRELRRNIRSAAAVKQPTCVEARNLRA